MMVSRSDRTFARLVMGLRPRLMDAGVVVAAFFIMNLLFAPYRLMGIFIEIDLYQMEFKLSSLR